MTTTALSIKNAEVVEKVRRLADHYGTSCTQAIGLAADEILSTPASEAETKRRVERIKACLAGIAPSVRASGHADDMYDAEGLPLW